MRNPKSFREKASQCGEKISDKSLILVSLAALGIVFGDIGTSTLYALRECFSGEHPLGPTPENVLGILSLILWTLIVTVSVKHILYLMRMDNRGESGILALMALLSSWCKREGSLLIFLGMFGAAR